MLISYLTLWISPSILWCCQKSKTYHESSLTLITNETLKLAKICLSLYKNTHPTIKTWFNTKMHGSTQNYLVWHKLSQYNTKMPHPACINFQCYHQIPFPLLIEVFISILIKHFVFENKYRGANKIKLILIHFQCHYKTRNSIIPFLFAKIMMHT